MNPAKFATCSLPHQAPGNHDMTMTRRTFLSASAALATAPVLGRQAWGAHLPREADIVVIGAGFAGKDLKDVSVVDKVRDQDRNSAIACRQGLGTLISKLSEQLPLSLSTPASRIEWSNRDAAVQTPAGKITARAVIVTVS